MLKRMIFMLIGVGIVLGSIIGFETFRPMIIRNAISKMPVQKQTISTFKVAFQDWQQELSAVGSLRAANGADLASEVAGIVDTINFKSGDDVEAGAVVARLRADDDVAKLRSLQASADLAQIVLARDQKQLKAQAVSQAIIDTDTANLKNAKALADQQQALVDKKIIKAPFAGRLGIRAVDLGQYLAAGTTIVTLQQLDPIYVDFSLPQDVVSIAKLGAPVTLSLDGFPKESFTGEISAISPKVDSTTRNLQLRATFKNPDKKLLPGMFGRLKIRNGEILRLLTVPQTAISYNTFGDTVYLVDDKGPDATGEPQLVARQAFVTTSITRGDQIAVTGGLKEGDVIVSAGQIKIHNGSALLVNNAVQPTNDPNPHPTEE